MTIATDFWDGRITSDKKPLRLNIRNICGDETVWQIELLEVIRYRSLPEDQ
jgi:hypothetical protein